MRTQDELIEIAERIETQFRESGLNAAEVLMVMGLLNGFVQQTYTMMHMLSDEDENYICEDCQKEILEKYEDKGENNNGC